MSHTVPLSIKQITLSLDGQHLLLTIFPCDSPVKAENIVALLQHPTLPKFKCDPQGISDAVTLFSSLEQVDDNNYVEFAPIIIATKQDGQFNITIADDKMSAYAELTTACGGDSITLSDMKEKCDDLDLKFGILPKSMLALLNTCQNSTPGKSYKMNIANGKPPVNGIDSTFKKLVKTDNHRQPKPQLLPDGRVDMLNLGKAFTVKAGALLMQKIPATIGQPGKTVTGELINQQVGRDHQFPDCKHTKMDPKNPLFLRASANGIPIDDGDFIRVDDIQILEEISVKTGNVDYDGTVIIIGDIHEGMTVKASGDITVMGLIESSKITCGGDLTVKMPILGNQRKSSTELSCVIKCEGNLTGTIAQYAQLDIGKNLIMSDQLMHCSTTCKGSVLVHNDSLRKGNIIGGLTSANGNITTVIMGTNAGNKTVIDLVGKFNELTQDKNTYTQQVQEAHTLLDRIKKEDIKTDSLLDIARRKAIKKGLAIKKEKYRSCSDQIQAKLFETKMKLTNYYSTTNLTVTGKLFSDITVNIGKRHWYSSTEIGPTVVSINSDDTIQLSAYQGAQHKV